VTMPGVSIPRALRQASRVLGIAAAAAVVPAAPAAAQAGGCVGTLTIGQCIVSLTGASAARLRLAQKTTGLQSARSDAAAAIKDYIPKLAVALNTPGLSDDPKSLGLPLTFPLNDGRLFNLGLIAQLEGAVNQPPLFTPLLDSIAPAARDAVRD